MGTVSFSQLADAAISKSTIFFNNAIEALKTNKSYIGYVNFKAGQGESVSDDIYKLVHGTSPVYQFTLSTATEAQRYFDESDILGVFAQLPQKQVMRLVQALNGLNQGLIKHFDKSHARIMLALLASGKGVRTSQLHRIAANARVGADNDQALRERVNALFSGAHGVESVLSKQSNFSGQNGYAEVLGVTGSEGYGHNRIVHLNLDHSFTKAFIKLVSKSNDGQLKELFKGKE